MRRLAALLLLAALCGAAHGASQQQTMQQLADPDSILAMLQPDLGKPVAEGGSRDDAAIWMYHYLFGPFVFLPYVSEEERQRINDSGNSATLLAVALGYTNLIAYALAAVVIMATMVSSTIATAAEGVPLGRKFSTVWLPLRNGVALALLAPVPGVGGGIFSMAQVGVVWMLMLGSAGGSSMWQLVLNGVMDGSGIRTKAGVPHEITAGMKNLSYAIACTRAAEGMGSNVPLVATKEDRWGRLDGIFAATVYSEDAVAQAGKGQNAPAQTRAARLFSGADPQLLESLDRKDVAGTELIFVDGYCGGLSRASEHPLQQPAANVRNATFADKQYDANWAERFLWRAEANANRSLLATVPRLHAEVVEPILSIRDLPAVVDALGDEREKRLGKAFLIHKGEDPDRKSDGTPGIEPAARTALVREVDEVLAGVRESFRDIVWEPLPKEPEDEWDKAAGGKPPKIHAVYKEGRSHVAQAQGTVQHCLRQARGAGAADCGAIQENWRAGLDLRGWATAGSFFFELSQIPRTVQDGIDLFKVESPPQDIRSVAAQECAEQEKGWLGKGWAVLTRAKKTFLEVFCNNLSANDVKGALGFLDHALEGVGGQASWDVTEPRSERRASDFLNAAGLAEWAAEYMMAGDDNELGYSRHIDFDQRLLSDDGANAPNPFIVLAETGENAIEVSVGVYAMALASAIGGRFATDMPKVFSAVTAAVAVTLEWLATLIGATAAALWAAGVVLAYLIPILPLITWVFLVASYALMAIECVAAAPLAVVMMCTPEGEGISGTKMQTAIQIVAAAILSPCLLVLGLLASLALSYVVFAFFHDLYWNFVNELVADSAFSALAFLLYFVMYVGLCYQICRWCVSVMPALPNSILAWFATGAGRRLGDFQGSDGSTQGVLAAAGGVVAKTTGNAMKSLRRREEGGDGGGGDGGGAGGKA